MSGDPFKLDNIQDLPELLKKEVKAINMRKETKFLLELFDLKNRLSIDEILVALYRLHKMEKTRVWVSSTLYNLAQKGLITKVEKTKGVYEKKLIF